MSQVETQAYTHRVIYNSFIKVIKPIETNKKMQKLCRANNKLPTYQK